MLFMPYLSPNYPHLRFQVVNYHYLILLIGIHSIGSFHPHILLNRNIIPNVFY